MADFEYVVESRFPPRDWSSRQVLERPATADRLDRFLGKNWMLAQLRRRGDDFGPMLPALEIKRRSMKALDNHDEDYKVFVRRRRDGKVLSIHKSVEVPPPPDLNFGCHPQIERAYELLMQRFGKDGIRNGGVYYCRNVDGTSVVSRHGYHDYPRWKGAAGDIFSSPDTMGELVDRAYFLVNQTKGGNVDLDRIIVAQSQWTQAGEWDYYPGPYHRHIHIEVWSGRPCSP